jgi:hypothetical protein
MHHPTRWILIAACTLVISSWAAVQPAFADLLHQVQAIRGDYNGITPSFATTPQTQATFNDGMASFDSPTPLFSLLVADLTFNMGNPEDMTVNGSMVSGPVDVVTSPLTITSSLTKQVNFMLFNATITIDNVVHTATLTADAKLVDPAPTFDPDSEADFALYATASGGTFTATWLGVDAGTEGGLVGTVTWQTLVGVPVAHFEIDPIAVPEPGSQGLWSLVVLGWMAIRSRRSARAHTRAT